MILDFLLNLFLDSIGLVFQVYMILTEILVETTFLQVELIDQQTARNCWEQYAVLYCTMDNDGCIIWMFTSDKLVKSVLDSIVLGCEWSIFNKFGRTFFILHPTNNLQEP